MPQNWLRLWVLTPIVFLVIMALFMGLSDATLLGSLGWSRDVRMVINPIVGIVAAILITKLIFGERVNK